MAAEPLPRTDESGHYPLAIDFRFNERIASYRNPAELQNQWVEFEEMIDDLPSTNYRPLPSARRFHRSKKRFRFAIGGNRSSKSQSLCMETFWYATGTHPFKTIETPNLGWYATTTWDKVGDTLWVKMKVLLQGWKHQIVWHNRARDIPEMVRIEVDGGFSTIVFKAYEQGREAFQAAACRYVAFDEQFPRDVFIEATSRIGAEYSLDFMAAMTPIESQPWLEERLTSGKYPSDEVFEYPLDDNRVSRGGFLKDDEVDAMIENWPPEVRDTRRLGKWGGYAGTVFQTFNRAMHVVLESDEARFFPAGRIPVTANIIGAIDWGGANPFCFLWGVRIPHLNNDWYIFDEYYWDFLLKGGRRLKEHADAILDRTRTTWGRELFRVWADHDPTDANEFAGYGIFSMPADKKLIRPTIECVQGLLNPRKHLANERWPGGRPRLHIAARCVNLLREIPMYHYPDATKNLNAKEHPVDKDNHAVSALRYLVYSDPEGAMTVYTPPAELTNDGRRDFLDMM